MQAVEMWLEIQYLAMQELLETLGRFPSRDEVVDKVEQLLRATQDDYAVH